VVARGGSGHVWSCGVVDWVGKPPISPTPSPGHCQVTVAAKVVTVTASVSKPTSPSIVDPRIAAAVEIARAASASKVPRTRKLQSHGGGVLQEEF